MKLPIKVAAKSSKMVTGVNPTFLKATLMAPKKTKATAEINKASRIAKTR